MKRKLAALFLHPYFLSILTLLMLVLFYSSIKVTWFFLHPANHFQEAVELWEGFGTILLGLGVFLEERPALQHILGLDPVRARKEEEDAVEAVCHDYGVIFVIFGVIIELFAWLVKIPNEVLDTYGIEFTFLNVAALAATFSAVLQIKFFFEILAAHFKRRK
ncbi:MAG: hypothetical protein H7222_05195 [Methylotenera sp.]|nr:hypothetical protein [Oligoflexia bacterium]